ncbi:MAG: phosphate ABC transporter permease subunit PstC [Ignavibacteria bacterium]|jgi:phosphate transport system permease protein
MIRIDTPNSSPYAKSKSKKTLLKERVIKYFFTLNSLVVIVLFTLILAFLLKEGLKALDVIAIKDFIYKTVFENGKETQIYQWYPTSDQPRYSLIPLILGSLLISIPATLISTVFGISVGIYLSEIATNRTRELLKPVIEIFAGIPTVVLGFFMLVVVASIFQDIFNPINRLNAFIASLGLSFIIIPIITSLTEDALNSVPKEIRMASYALGANKFQTIFKVLIPTAVSGLSASIILGFGRAIGETMIVLMASGNAAAVSIDLFRSVRTMTATIAAELGEVSQDSAHYSALFFIGLVLFVITFILNLIAELILNKMRKKIDY